MRSENGGGGAEADGTGEPGEPDPADTRAADYAELASVGPYGVRPGHALITMVEPHPGHEYSYNRWYEDDHYIAGAMAMPWIYAGRRWVAPRDLQLLRYPADSAVASPVTAGCYLSTYWITEGRYDEHMKWTVGINRRLNRDGRVHHGRTHVFTAFHDHAATVYRDGAAGPRDHHALDHPYAGLVLEVVDAAGPERRNALLEWLRTRRLPGRLRGSAAAMVTVFRPTPLPGDRMTYVKQVEGVDTRLTLLWFLEEDPRDQWEERFGGLGEAVAATGLGRVELVAPFVPTVPGTDRYVDRLR
ncbi:MULTISPECIES: hypothetical protein [Streptomyces]|uniref:hypothetical protein n=1 Tax=Streptomyces TaxID=1883 RepID=UPI00025CD8D7|nr:MULTISPECIES: hypothetical protein [Streptomyces]AZK94601.1 hypothetical protein B7R87_12555 [Streptomyces tsukubensis]EIF90377.1 hypothetical protein [Streptomyces tsukubensis NRRL18488]